MAHQIDPTLRSGYELIIQKVVNSELLPDSQGIVHLPHELASITQNGSVYVTKSNRGGIFIAFSTWIGKGYNMRGYLYTSSPLAIGDTHRDYYENEVLKVGPTEVVIERKLSENWYSISRSLD